MRQYKNKDNLPANREGRKRHKTRQYNAFGAYRPLTADSQFELDSAVAEIALDVRKYIERTKPDSSTVYQMGRMALTFVQYGHVRSVMRRGGLRHGLALGRQLERIETADLSVPFNDVVWVGNGNRKLALKLDRASDAYSEIEQVAETVEKVLCDGVSGPKVRVGVPDHVSILRYGHPRDGRPLGIKQRAEITDQAWNILVDREIEAVALGKLMIGEDYDTPL